ncbi:hypothetical protein V8G57_02460 [Collimonas sp. H4R21]|uniref:Uncharacterized protein n=1 Tax=Collimonas rhizosphaerae TaxID=3126357 RepID=A0ABU9PQG2_9BURK
MSATDHRIEGSITQKNGGSAGRTTSNMHHASIKCHTEINIEGHNGFQYEDFLLP